MPGLHFLAHSSLLHVSSCFFFWLSVFLPSFARLFIEKEKKLPNQLAWASWLLNAEGTHSPKRAISSLGELTI